MARRIDEQRLTAAAARVFARHGFHAARVSEIAREAGVAQGTVYLYFKSKEGLYVAVLERLARQIREASAGLAWTSVTSANALRDQFADLYTEIFETCAASRGVAGLLLGGPPVGRSSEVRSELLRDAEAVSVAYLEAGASAGLLRSIATTTVARAIVGLLLHTVTRTIVEDGRADGLRALAEELLDFELHGLLAPADRTQTAHTAVPAAPMTTS